MAGSARSANRFGTVRDLMRTEFPTISPEADLFGEGGRVLRESGLHAIPVVKDGELVACSPSRTSARPTCCEAFGGGRKHEEWQRR